MNLDLNAFLAEHGGRGIHPAELEFMFFGEFDAALEKATRENDTAKLDELKAQLETVARSE